LWSLLLTEQQEVSTKNFLAFVIKVAFLFWFWAHVSSDQVKMAEMHMGKHLLITAKTSVP
jgi:ABC-type arginine transport system permease subunit